MRLLAMLLAALCMVAGRASASEYAFGVDLRTDMVPGHQFTAVITTMRRTDPLPPRTLGYFSDGLQVQPGDDFNRPVHVAEFHKIPEGEYLVTVNLVGPDGRTVGSRVSHIALTSNFGLTIGIGGGALKNDLKLSLVGDRDGNGAISYGDTVRRTVTIEGVTSSFDYVDRFESGDILCAGSVRAPGGLVVVGSRQGDRFVKIHFERALGSSAENFEFSYDAIVAPKISAQGKFELGTGSFNTDNSASQDFGDPTIGTVRIPAEYACWDGTPTVYQAPRAKAEPATPTPPGGPLADRSKFGGQTGDPSADGVACRVAVQGKVAWNSKGDRIWSEANLDSLCRGARQSVAPAKCVDAALNTAQLRNGGAAWTWQDSVALCAATLDSEATLQCARDALARGVTRQALIELCRRRL